MIKKLPVGTPDEQDLLGLLRFYQGGQKFYTFTHYLIYTKSTKQLHASARLYRALVEC